MDLKPDVPLHSDVMAPMGFVVQPSRPIAVSDGDAIHDHLDPCAFADDLDIIPHVLVVGMKPFPPFGGMFRLIPKCGAGQSSKVNSIRASPGPVE